MRDGRAPPRNFVRTVCLARISVEANVGKPQVAYKETITDSGKAKPSSQTERRPRTICPR